MNATFSRTATALATNLLLSVFLVSSLGTTPALAADSALEIPFEKFVLDNGLTLIVHEDKKAPIVAVNVWYHVGSKDEKPGKTGFAHLFEHLMFNGSENFDDDYFKAIEKVGATDLNGTTNADRTNYFQNVPKTALDTALWLESDRMGHLKGAITQERLDEQRGVVQNEKRQGENQPYGKVFTALGENSYPEGHPYSWPTIGSMEDLNAASLEDVHDWFDSKYGAANAVLVIAGDVDAQAVKAMVERYFGDIDSGPPLPKKKAWIAKRSGEKRVVMQDRVPQARVYQVWNIPGWGTEALDTLDIASTILSNGKTARLYRRLVYEDQIATDAGAFVLPRELGGLFIVQASVVPGGNVAAVEKALSEELQNFLEEGPNPDELESALTVTRAGFIRGAERIGGFGGKSDILAASEVYGGSPDAYLETMAWQDQLDATTIRETMREWLSDGKLTLEVLPFPEYNTKTTDVDRSTLPVPDTFPVGDFPNAERTRLSNGLEVVFVERRAVPVVNMRLLVDAGYVADHNGKSGVASLAMDMLDEGTTTRTALEISEEISKLGARLGAGSNLDTSTVTLSTLAENLDASLEIFADVILNPSFDDGELERRRAQRLAGIQREKAQPTQMALRVLPKLLYGGDHPYGMPFTGTGTEGDVQSIERSDLAGFHQTWFRPNNARLLVVGATSLDEITTKLEAAFRSWKPGDVPTKRIPEVELAKGQKIYLIDKPGAEQSIIFAAHVMPPKANDDETALQAMNDVLGGSFTARINMNLREDKHWSYGARSMVIDARAQRPFFVMAPVQTDKTKESLEEVISEVTGLVGENPATEDELARVKDQNTLTLPGRWETSNAILGDLAEIETFDLPEDWWSTYGDRVKGLDLDQVRGAAEKYLHPDNIVWVVVGDRSVVEEGLRDLGVGDIVALDPDGNLVE